MPQRVRMTATERRQRAVHRARPQDVSAEPTFKVSIRPAGSAWSLSPECPQCDGQRPHEQARWRAARGHQESVTTVSHTEAQLLRQSQPMHIKPPRARAEDSRTDTVDSCDLFMASGVDCFVLVTGDEF